MNEKQKTDLLQQVNSIIDFRMKDEVFKYHLDQLDVFSAFSKACKGYDENVYDYELQKIYKKELVKLTREFLGLVRSDYVDKFDKYNADGLINFNNEKKVANTFCFNHRNDESFINLNRTEDLRDVPVLVHEFFHFLNNSSNKFYSQRLFTESMSIIAEGKANRFLVEEGFCDDFKKLNQNRKKLLNNDYRATIFETNLLKNYLENGEVSMSFIDNWNPSKINVLYHNLNVIIDNNSSTSNVKAKGTILSFAPYVIGSLYSAYANMDDLTYKDLGILNDTLIIAQSNINLFPDCLCEFDLDDASTYLGNEFGTTTDNKKILIKK